MSSSSSSCSSCSSSVSDEAAVKEYAQRKQFEENPRICAICGSKIEDEAFEKSARGTLGQHYHWECVKKRQELGDRPELENEPEIKGLQTNPPFDRPGPTHADGTK